MNVISSYFRWTLWVLPLPYNGARKASKEPFLALGSERHVLKTCKGTFFSILWAIFLVHYQAINVDIQYIFLWTIASVYIWLRAFSVGRWPGFYFISFYSWIFLLSFTARGERFALSGRDTLSFQEKGKRKRQKIWCLKKLGFLLFTQKFSRFDPYIHSFLYKNRNLQELLFMQALFKSYLEDAQPCAFTQCMIYTPV